MLRVQKKFFLMPIILGVAAINSFMLLDFLDEALEQRPDAILIYAGHNEYYGALGAASTVTLSETASLIRLYLWLQHFKTIVLLRDAINRFMRAIQGSGSELKSKFPTLIGQVIAKDHIPLGSDIYEKGQNPVQRKSSTLARENQGRRGARNRQRTR